MLHCPSARRVRSVVLLIALPFSACIPTRAAVPTASTPQTFATADTLAPWTFSDGPEWPGAQGKLEWQAAGGHDVNDGCLALSYDFTGGGNYVAAIAPLNADPPVKAVRMWIHKPSGHLLIIRAQDAKGEVFQKNFRYHFPGWQEVLIGLDDWIFSWGGDGKFDEPAREFHLLVENDGGNAQGTVLFDDVQWVYKLPDVVTGNATATYTESDFAADEPWFHEAATNGTYDHGTWRYAFSADRTETHLNRDRSLLARPRKLILTVESDGSGHELRARIGSHFQLFERALGTLDRQGELRFEVPLGDMTTWEHFGGEDDGIVRYPLRLVRLSLIRRGEPAEGVVTLKSLEVETEYDPATQRAFVIPDAALHAENADVVDFNVTVRSLADGAEPAKLLWETHAADRKLETGVEPLELRPNGLPTHVKLQRSWHGMSVLEGRFRVQLGDWSSPETSTTVAQLPPAVAKPPLNPGSRMGVGVYLYRFHGHPEAKQWLDRMCDVAARAGVKWTREEFHWNWMEPEPGQWDFTFFDQLVDSAEAHGISVYALCCYWTAWSANCTDEGIEQYCKYLETLVRRYGDRIHHWEIWNEPNIFFWDCDKRMYVKLLNRAYATIKAVDPNAQVLGCSTAGIDVKFIQMVLDEGGQFDALTVHPYRGTLDGPAFAAELQRTQQLASGRDVWITEMGWPSDLNGLTERQQAQYVARTYVSALASGAVRSIAWYDFREDGDDAFYNEHNFGLIRNNLTPKMGYRALAAVGNLLGTADVVGPLELPVGLVGWRFKTDAGETAALWSQDQPRLVRLRVAGDDVQAVNVVGDAAQVVRRDDELLVLLDTDTPLYLAAAGPLRVTVADSPLNVTVEPAAIHAGDSLALRVAADPDLQARVTPPPNWQIRTTDAGYALTAPADARPGPHAVPIEVTAHGQTMTLTLEVSIVPSLLRG